MKTIRVGIIGQGRSGRGIHGAHLSGTRKRYRIVAASDALEERRKRAAEEFRCDMYADYRDLLSVRTSTWSSTHAQPSARAGDAGVFLNAGFNVLCEKPLARKARKWTN